MNTLALNRESLFRYLRNCFILLIPIIIWNVAFTDLLPESFKGDNFNSGIPAFIIWIENFTRLLVFALPAFMPLTIFYKYQKFGLAFYFIGTFLYFLSWRPLILYPDGVWSSSLIGYLAPAITPIIFLVGVGLIGHRLFFNVKYKKVTYILISTVFVIFHAVHVVMAYGSIK